MESEFNAETTEIDAENAEQKSDLFPNSASATAFLCVESEFNAETTEIDAEAGEQKPQFAS